MVADDEFVASANVRRANYVVIAPFFLSSLLLGSCSVKDKGMDKLSDIPSSVKKRS